MFNEDILKKARITFDSFLSGKHPDADRQSSDAFRATIHRILFPNGVGASVVDIPKQQQFMVASISEACASSLDAELQMLDQGTTIDYRNTDELIRYLKGISRRPNVKGLNDLDRSFLTSF